jgi:hypothetical protein
MALIAITLLTIALAVVVTYHGPRPMPEPPLMALIAPPHGVFADTFGRIGPPQISPDGTRIAFIGCKTESAAWSMLGGKDCSIWLRVLASDETREVPDTSGAYYPFWSPDGREIAFFADGKVPLMPGGAVGGALARSSLPRPASAQFFVYQQKAVNRWQSLKLSVAQSSPELSASAGRNSCQTGSIFYT